MTRQTRQMTCSNGRGEPGRPLTGLLLRCIAVLLLAACDNTFDPIVTDRDVHFAVFGYLDTEADTQFVRVSPIRSSPVASLDPDGITVSAVRLEDGASFTWQDSLVRLDNGELGLLYFLPMTVRPGETYRLLLARAADETTSAVAGIPARTPVLPGPVAQDTVGRFVQDVILQGASQRPHELTLLYRVVAPAGDTVTIPLAYYEGGHPVGAGWELPVYLSENRTTVLRILNVPDTDSSIVLLDVGLEIERRSDEWRTPEENTNIRNGRGFFGARARFIERWFLDDTTTLHLGFAPPP